MGRSGPPSSAVPVKHAELLKLRGRIFAPVQLLHLPQIPCASERERLTAATLSWEGCTSLPLLVGKEGIVGVLQAAHVAVRIDERAGRAPVVHFDFDWHALSLQQAGRSLHV